MINYLYLLNRIKSKVINWQNPDRVNFIDIAMTYCKHNKIDGNYFEFGVYKGDTFQYAYHAAKMKGLTSMTLFAFDSFQGFSEPGKSDGLELIKKGDRSCSISEFTQNIKKWGVKSNTITIIPGWFSETLTGKGALQTKKLINGKNVALAYFDADLFEPTKLALDFVTPYLSDGAILAFDNWFLFKGHPNRGERKAFSEWSTKHHEFLLSEYYKFGWHGNSFIVNRKSSS